MNKVSEDVVVEEEEEEEDEEKDEERNQDPGPYPFISRLAETLTGGGYVGQFVLVYSVLLVDGAHVEMKQGQRRFEAISSCSLCRAVASLHSPPTSCLMEELAGS